MNVDREPQIPPFTSTPGIQVALPNEPRAGDFMRLFLDDEFFDLLVTQTNLYTIQYKRNNPNLPRRSQAQSWFDTTRGEMKKFIALSLLMGVVRKPELSDYRSTNPLLQVQFSTVLCLETVTKLFYVFCILLIIPSMILMMPIGTGFTKSGYL